MCVVIQGSGGSDFSLEWGQLWVHKVGLRNTQEVGGARLISSHWFIYFAQGLICQLSVVATNNLG